MLLKELRHLAVAVDQNLDEVFGDVVVPVVVEGGSKALVADATGATDTVNVFGDAAVHAGWEIVVDDVLTALDVPPASGDAGGDEDRSLASTERTPGKETSVKSRIPKSMENLHGILALTLITAGVDGSCR